VAVFIERRDEQHLVRELGAGGEERRQSAGRDEVIGAPQIGDDGLAHGAVETRVLDYLDVSAMARFFDAKKHGDLQKQATTESDSFSQIKIQIYANVAPRFEKAAALHQSNQVLALTTAILLFKLGLRLLHAGRRVAAVRSAGNWAPAAPFENWCC